MSRKLTLVAPFCFIIVTIVPLLVVDSRHMVIPSTFSISRSLKDSKTGLQRHPWIASNDASPAWYHLSASVVPNFYKVDEKQKLPPERLLEDSPPAVAEFASDFNRYIKQVQQGLPSEPTSFAYLKIKPDFLHKFGFPSNIHVGAFKKTSTKNNDDFHLRVKKEAPNVEQVLPSTKTFTGLENSTPLKDHGGQAHPHLVTSPFSTPAAMIQDNATVVKLIPIGVNSPSEHVNRVINENLPFTVSGDLTNSKVTSQANPVGVSNKKDTIVPPQSFQSPFADGDHTDNIDLSKILPDSHVNSGNIFQKENEPLSISQLKPVEAKSPQITNLHIESPVNFSSFPSPSNLGKPVFKPAIAYIGRKPDNLTADKVNNFSIDDLKVRVQNSDQEVLPNISKSPNKSIISSFTGQTPTSSPFPEHKTIDSSPQNHPHVAPSTRSHTAVAPGLMNHSPDAPLSNNQTPGDSDLQSHTDVVPHLQDQIHTVPDFQSRTDVASLSQDQTPAALDFHSHNAAPPDLQVHTPVVRPLQNQLHVGQDIQSNTPANQSFEDKAIDPEFQDQTSIELHLRNVAPDPQTTTPVNLQFEDQISFSPPMQTPAQQTIAEAGGVKSFLPNSNAQVPSPQFNPISPENPLITPFSPYTTLFTPQFTIGGNAAPFNLFPQSSLFSFPLGSSRSVFS